jgi:ribonuclease HI
MNEVTYNFDGGGGTDGPSGWGWARNDGVTGCGGLAPGTTSNVAEYTALTMAVRDAITMYQTFSESSFIFQGDSKLVVEQVTGNWQVRTDKLRPYVNNVQMLLEALPTWNLKWIPRNQNKLADGLAWKGKTLWTPNEDNILISGPHGSVMKELQRGWR